jgi:hypothetical protein
LETPVPRPRDLLALLAKGDFTSEVLWQALLRNGGQVDRQWIGWQHDQLADILGKIEKNQGFGLPKPFYTDRSALALAAGIFAHETTMGLAPHEQRLLHEQTKALLTSSNFAEFKRRVEGAIYRAEQERLALAAHEAKTNRFFHGIGVGLNAIMWPGQFARSVGTASIMLTNEAFTNDQNIFEDIYWGVGGDNGLSASENRELWFKKGEDAFHNLTPWARIPLELIYDPINLLAPIKVGTSLIRLTGVGGAKVGGYYLTKEGAKPFTRFWLGGSYFKYQKSTYHLPAKAFAGTVIKSIPGVRQATKLKTAAMADALDSVMFSGRHNFENPGDLPEGVNFLKRPEKVKAEIRALVRQTDEVYGSSLRHDAMPELYKVLSDNVISIYVDKGRTNLTNVGRSILGRVAEEIRKTSAERIANSLAQDAYDEVIEAARQAGVTGYSKAVLDQAKAAYSAEWDRVADSVGLFLAGTPKALTKADKDLVKRLDRAVASRLHHFEDVTLKAMQGELERDFLARGVTLWDEGLLWVGRGSNKAAEALRSVARGAFAASRLVDVHNPMFGVERNFEEYKLAVDSEIRRNRARIIRFHSDEEAAGRIFPENWVDEELAAEKKRIMGYYKQPRAGVWVDEREVLTVPDIYARVQKPGVAGVRGGLEELGEVSAPGVVNALDAEINKFVWDAGGFFNDSLAKKALGSEGAFRGSHVLPADPVLRQAELDRIARVKKAAAEAHSALARGVDHAMPHALNENWAFMVAMSKAQSAGLHGLYRGIRLGMDSWVLATLPLRQGWVVRNVADNAMKLFMEGVRDPRYYWSGAEFPGRASGQLVRSVFDLGLNEMTHALKFLDAQFGTHVAADFRELMESVWTHGAEQLEHLFVAHDVFVPREVLEQAQFNPMMDEPKMLLHGLSGAVDTEAVEHPDLVEYLVRKEIRDRDAGAIAARVQTFKENVWYLFGNKPENHFKRAMYRAEFQRATKELRESGDFITPGLEKGVFRGKLDFDPDVLARVKREIGVPDDVQVVITRVNNTERLVSGSYYDKTRTAVVRVDDLDLFEVTTRQELDEVIDRAVYVTLHELKHASDFENPVTLSISRLTSQRIKELAIGHREVLSDWTWEKLYRSQPHEIRANLTAGLKQKRFKGLVKHVDGPPLPSQFDDSAIALAAHDRAWAKVEKALFDYSKITVVEDNFRVFFPFIQFWRKNSSFWIRHIFRDSPWLFPALTRLDEDRNSHHADWPEWMKHYINTQEIVDATAQIPGLGWLTEHALPQNGQYDPFNLPSFAPLWRIYEQEVLGRQNDLPPDQKGMRFFAPFIDAIENTGLGLNPFFRKPLEALGVADTQAWRMVWPQTSLVQAFTRRFVSENIADFIVDLDALWGFPTFQHVPSKDLAENFDQYVNKIMIEFEAKGEPMSRERAEKVAKAWFWEQNLHGYFTSFYYRRSTPEDYYLDKLHESVVTGEKDFGDLSPKDARLEGLMLRRHDSKIEFDRYVETLPGIEGYFNIHDSKTRAAYLQEHPDVLKYVDPLFTKGSPYSKNYLIAAEMYNAGQTWFDTKELMDDLGLPSSMQEDSYRILVTPEIEEFWNKNDSPKEVRDRMVRGETLRHMHDLNQAYFAIPETDFVARQGFLSEHPELSSFWVHNNSQSDDYRAILNTANADLRTHYFQLVKEQGWDVAGKLLKEYPFMFEFTKAADRVDMQTGEWIGNPKTPRGRAYVKAKDSIQAFIKLIEAGNKQGAFAFLDTPAGKLAQEYFLRYGKHGSPERAQAFLEAKVGLTKFHKLMETKGKSAAYAWLDSGDPDATLARNYMRKYSDKEPSEHGIDFRNAKPELEHYFDLQRIDPDSARKWLASERPEAKVVRQYFEKWGLEGGHSGLSRAYLAARKDLIHYYDLPPGQRKAWLASGTVSADRVEKFLKMYGHEHGMNAQADAYLSVLPELKRYGKMTKVQRKDFLASAEGADLLDFFKRYGKTGRMERAFKKAHPDLIKSRDATLHSRLIFWKQYYELTPDKRPAFVYKNAENAGIFIFGAHGEGDTDEKEEQFLMGAMAAKDGKKNLTPQEATYIYVKPLMDAYYDLPKGAERDLFLRANPELKDYFDRWVHHSLTGDKEKDKVIEGYFKLPPNSLARSAYLVDHPEVQMYFDAHSPPAERAMRKVLQAYFDIPYGPGRQQFLVRHPEIQVYFDARAAARDEQATQLRPFMLSDPSLFEGRESAEEVQKSAETMRHLLRQGRAEKLAPDTLERRVQRRAVRA